jgi:signal transduction histidine kinase
VVFEASFGNDFKLRVVDSGRAALEVLEKESVAVVITDQRMPDMAGNELLGLVRVRYPDIVRIVVTAYGDLEPILGAVNDGLVARYLVKPWERAEMAEVLRWAVQTWRMGQEDSAVQLRLLETERLAALGSMSAAMFHDVRQPLTYILANTERLNQLAVALPALKKLLDSEGEALPSSERRDLQSLVEELPGIAADVEEGCQLIANLTESIRSLVKGTDDKARAGPDPDPLRTIRYAMSMCEHAVMSARARVLYSGPATLPPIRMTATHLLQTLINLISNAAQAFEDIQRDGARVEVQARVDDNVLELLVSDNGKGIPEENLKRIGQPFFTTRVGGTGLGFAQCRRLVEQADGKIRIDSEVGKGTRISITLPLATAGGSGTWKR